MIRLGLIGGGFLMQVAHAPAFERLPNVELVALSEPEAELREPVARRFGIKRSHASHDDLLAGGDLHALVVSLPRFAQELVVGQALGQGVPVLSEKPMATTLEAATALLETSRASGGAWAVGFMRRHDEGVRRFADLLAGFRESGEMGAILHVAMRDFCARYAVEPPHHARRSRSRQHRYPEAPHHPDHVRPEQAGAYDFSLNVLAHDIDLLRMLFGELDVATFRARPAAQGLTLRAAGFDLDLVAGRGALGTWDQVLDVTFERGRLSLALPSSLRTQACGLVTVTSGGESRTIDGPPDIVRWAFDHQAENFIRSIETGEPSRTAAEACIGGMEIIDAMWRVVEWQF